MWASRMIRGTDSFKLFVLALMLTLNHPHCQTQMTARIVFLSLLGMESGMMMIAINNSITFVKFTINLTVILL